MLTMKNAPLADSPMISSLDEMRTALPCRHVLIGSLDSPSGYDYATVVGRVGEWVSLTSAQWDYEDVSFNTTTGVLVGNSRGYRVLYDAERIAAFDRDVQDQQAWLDLCVPVTADVGSGVIVVRR